MPMQILEWSSIGVMHYYHPLYIFVCFTLFFIIIALNVMQINNLL